MNIELIEENTKYRNTKHRIDTKGIKHKEFPDRVCCYSKHIGDPHVTRINPSTGVAIWRKFKTNGEWDGKSWICDVCFKKPQRLCRNNETKQSSNQGKGSILRLVTVEWINNNNKDKNCKDCNISTDNFNSPVDIYDPIMYKSVTVRSVQKTIKTAYDVGRRYEYLKYHVPVDKEKGRERNFDYLFAYCMSDNYGNIDMVFIIPVNELTGAAGFDIDPYKSGTYEKYKYNKIEEFRYIFHKLNFENCPTVEKENNSKNEIEDAWNR